MVSKITSGAALLLIASSVAASAGDSSMPARDGLAAASAGISNAMNAILAPVDYAMRPVNALVAPVTGRASFSAQGSSTSTLAGVVATPGATSNPVPPLPTLSKR